MSRYDPSRFPAFVCWTQFRWDGEKGRRCFPCVTQDTALSWRQNLEDKGDAKYVKILLKVPDGPILTFDPKWFCANKRPAQDLRVSVTPWGSVVLDKDGRPFMDPPRELQLLMDLVLIPRPNPGQTRRQWFRDKLCAATTSEELDGAYNLLLAFYNAYGL